MGLLMVIPVMPLVVSVPQTAELELEEVVEEILHAESKFATSPSLSCQSILITKTDVEKRATKLANAQPTLKVP